MLSRLKRLIIIIPILFLHGVSFGQSLPSGVSVPNLAAVSGTTVGIPVRVEPGEVASADIWLAYDAAYLTPTDVVGLGSFFSESSMISTDISPTQVRIALARSSLVNVTAQSTLVIVYFDVLKSSGTSTISFAKSLINGTEVTGSPGTITFTPIQQQPAGISVPNLAAVSETTVGIPVRVEPGEVASADIWLQYDATCLAPTGEVVSGTLFSGSFIDKTIRTDFSPAQVRIALAGSDLVNVATKTDLVIVYFNVLQSSGTSEIGFAKSLINGAEVTGSPGTITFTPIQEQPTGVSVPNLSVASGTTVGIPVRVEPGEVASADIWLQYDAAYLAPTGEVVSGTLFSGSFIDKTIRTDFSPAQVRIALAGDDLVNVTTQTDLVIVYFNVLKSSGTSTISFAKNLINGADVTGSPGTITFTPIQEQPTGVSVPNLSVASGMTVGIPVRVEPGEVASADIWLQYDAAYLTPTGEVGLGPLFESSMISTDLAPSQVRIALAGDDLVNVTAQTDLVIVYFNVLQSSGTSEIGFAKNLINGAEVPGTLGTITFTTIQQPTGVSVPNLSVVSGTTVGIPVKVEPGEVASADIWLQYDATYLTPTGDVGLGSDFTGSTIVKTIRTDLAPAQVRIALARGDLVDVTAQADLVIVYFNVLQSSGTSEISFAKSLINGAEVTATSGIITFTLQPTTFSLPHAVGDIGGTVTVALSSGSVSGVRGMDFWIAFDQTVITPASATLDAGLVSQGFQMQQNLSDPGFVKFSIASGSPQDISGALVYITFNIEGSSSDSTTLTFNKIVINEGAISPTPVSGSIAVNGAPVLDAPGSFSVTVGNILSFTLSASDPDGDAITFSSPNLPSGASLNSTSGVFSWAPPSTGIFTVTFQAFDGRLTSATESATINVASAPEPEPVVNHPPVISSIGDQTVAELETLLVSITVIDPDAGDEVLVTVEPLPAGASFTFDPIAGKWQFKYVPALGTAGVYNVTVSATDGKLSDSETIKITVTEAPVLPVLAAIGNRSVKVGERLAFQVTATDPSGRETIVLTITGLPAGATFDPATGLFSFTPTFAQVKIHSLTATATNPSGSVSEQFTITVVGVNRAPVIEPVPDKAISPGELVELTIVASDPDGDPVTLTAVGDPIPTLGATFDAETGEFNWTPAVNVIGNFRIVFVATDGKGGRAELAVIISVGEVNLPPVLGAITDKQVSAGQLLSFTFTASDPEEDPLTLTVLNRPTGAVTTFSAGTGTFTWTPTTEQVGTYKIDFIVKDKGGLTAQKSVTVEVAKVNRAPVISPISDRVVSEGERLNITVTASDPDNDPLVYLASGLPQGAVFDAGTRLFSFQPSFTQAGSYSVIFTVKDPDGLSASATVSIEVKDVNSPPEFGFLANQTVGAGSMLEFMVTATDPDNDPLTFTAQIPQGATFDAETGEFNWTPADADAGNHQATFTVRDGKDGTDSRSITISVTRPGIVINMPPVIEPIGSQAVETKMTLTFNVVASDPENAVSVLNAAGVPKNASFDNLTGAFTFTPDYDQVGSYAVIFSASDGQLFDELSVTITVFRGVNQAPVISGVSDQAVAAGTGLRFVVSASDPEGDEVILGVRNLPTGAVFNSASGEFNYTPTNDQAYTYNVVFTATDVLGAASESTMVLTVSEVNHPPVFAKLGNIVAMVDQRVEYVVNATDPDGDVLTYSSPFAASLEEATFNAETQMLTWTPETPGTFKVTFVITDGRGGTAETSVLATISSATQVINQPPVFDEIQNYVIDAGTDLTFTVSATDPEEAPLTYGAYNLPNNSSFNSKKRTFSFDPPLSQVGLFKPVFTVTDGKLTDQIEVEIQVSKVNQAPVLDEIPDRSVPEGEALIFFVTGSDPDNDLITLSAENLPENAKFLPASGSFIFEPEFGQAGSYDVTFTVTDPAGLTASQSVNIQVIEVNLPPELAFLDNQETEIGNLLELFVSATDPNDALSELTFSAKGLPKGATFSAANRVFRWTPDAKKIGTFRVTFSVTDPMRLKDKRTILITVIDPDRPINRPPVLATVGNKSVQETNTLSFQVSATDPDPGDVISLSIRGLPDGATFESSPAPNSVTGDFDFTPGLLDGGIYELTVSVTDDDFVDEEKVVLEVVELNVTPEISGVENHTAMVGEELVFEVQGVDESGEAVVLSVQNPPPGAIFLQATGRFSFTPTLAQAGMSYDVRFRVMDASGLFAEATSNIDVEAVNLPPEFLYTANQKVQEGSLLEFTVQANDPNGDELTYSAEDLPGSADFDAENQIFRWVPQSDQAGSYQITFEVKDPEDSSDQMAVMITVGDVVNSPPSIDNPGPQKVDEGETLTFTVTATDPDQDPITLTAVNLPEGASFSDGEDGSGQFSWSTGYRDQGKYRVTFKASDGVLTSKVRVKIKVRNVNKPPKLNPVGGVLLSAAGMKFRHVEEGIRLAADVTEIRTFTVKEGSRITVKIQVSDPGGDFLALSVRNLPPNAWLDQANSRIIFEPDYEQAGNYLVLIEVTDGVYTASMYAAFEVEEVNRAPILRPIGDRYVQEGKIVSFEINAFDPDGDPISYDFSGLPEVATLVNNLFTFDTELLPPDLQVDAVRFTFQAFDGRGGADSLASEIAVIRADSIDFTGTSLLLSGTIDPSDSVIVDIREGIGMEMSIKNTTGRNVTTDGSILVSEISGPLSEEVAEKIEQEIEFTLLAGATEGSGKIKLARQSTIQLAGGLETGFYSIRRAWGADLSRFTAVLAGLLQSTVAPGDSINVNITVSFQDSDLVRNFGVQDSTFMTNLVPAAWDSSQGKFVLLSGTVNALTNTGSFTIPLLSPDNSAKPQHTLYTVGALLDFNAPTIAVETKSFTTSGLGPYKIVAEVTDDLTGVQYVMMLYDIEGKIDSTLMELTEGKYEALIPIQEIGTVIKYYVVAMDNQGNICSMPEFTTYILSVTESGPGDVDENGSVDIFDLVALLKAWKNADLSGDINQDGVTNVWDLITLLLILTGRYEAVLAGSTEFDAGSPYSLIKSSLSQPEDGKQQYSSVFGIAINSRDVVSAAELHFKVSEELEIGTPKLIVDDPAVQICHVLEENKLRVLVFNMTGESLPLGTTLMEVGYKTEGDKSLTERMLVLESSDFGDLEGNKVEAMAVLEGIVSLPRSFTLSQNYPNPFNPSTSINYDIPDGDPVRVSLRVYNLRGQLVKVLVQEAKESGSYTVHWDGMDQHGRRLSSGVYFYRIQAGDFSKIRKMVVLK